MSVARIPKTKVIRLTLFALAFQALAIASFVNSTSDHGVGSGTASLRPNFHLRSSSGAIVDSHALRGRPYLLFFGFSNCPAVCPTTLMEAQALLREATPTLRPLSIYFVSVDPARDTPESLEAFVRGFGENVVGLTGTDEDVASAAKSVRAYISEQRDADGLNVVRFDHSALIYLVSSGGELFDILSVDEPRQRALYKIRTLSVYARL